jgi:hypothetical protein
MFSFPGSLALFLSIGIGWAGCIAVVKTVSRFNNSL